MRRIVVACAVLAVAALGVFLWWHFWGGVRNAFAPGALADYLPQDTAAVVALDLKDLRDRRKLDTPLGKALVEAMSKEELGLPFEQLGINPAKDVDTVRLAFSADDTSAPLVLLRGRFEPERFASLEKVQQEGFTLYKRRAEVGDVTLALAGDTLMACLVRPRVVAALHHATNPTAVALDDQNLKEMLEKLDRNRPLWLAVDVTRLGRPMTQAWAAPMLNPVLRNSQTISGGVAWNSELTARLELVAASEALAEKLQTHFQEVEKLTEWARFIRLEEYQRVLVQLLADAEVRRRGRELTLTSRIASP